MRYAIIPKKTAERHGLDPRLHQTLGGGERVVLNECELRRLGPDASAAAALISQAEALAALREDAAAGA